MVFTAALAIRLTVVLAMYGQDPFLTHPRADTIIYLERAQEILSGQILAGHVFQQVPLYPYLLVPGLALSVPILGMVLLQCLMDSTTAVLSATIAVRISKRPPVGLAAGLLYALGAEPIFFATKLLPVTPLLLAMTASLAVLLRGTLRSTFAAGLLIGVTALLWAGILPGMMLIAAWLLWDSRDVRRPALWLLGAGLGILPATAHNMLYEERPVMISAQGGITLHQGNNPRARGMYTSAGAGADIRTQAATAHQWAEELAGRKMTSSEASRFLTRRTQRWMVENPGTMLRLLGQKFYLLFAGREIPTMYSMVFEGRRFVPLLRWLPLTFTGIAILVPPAIVLLIGRDQRPLLLSLTLGAGIIATLLIVFVSTRYKMPLFPLACAWMAAAAFQLGQVRRGRLVLALLATLPGLVVGWRERDVEAIPLSLYGHVSDIRAEQGDLPSALLELELARNLRPGFAADRESRLRAQARRVPPVVLLEPISALELPPPGRLAAAASLTSSRGDAPLARRLGRLALAVGGDDPATRRLARHAMGEAP